MQQLKERLKMANKRTITVLMIEPRRHPYLKTVEHTLENLQAMVGGIITATYPWDDPVALIAGDESLYDASLAWNRFIDDYHFIRGNCFLVGLTRDDFDDIPMDLAQKYAEMFWMPESFINLGGSLIVIKEDDGTKPTVEV